MEKLTLLGNKQVPYSSEYDPTVLEVFDNKHRNRDYFVKFNCPEFTSLCPVTGQPDFAALTIAYVPDIKMLGQRLYCNPAYHPSIGRTCIFPSLSGSGTISTFRLLKSFR